MLFRNFNFIRFLRTSGLKKKILPGNKFNVKVNIRILIRCIFTYIHSVSLACVLNSLFSEIRFLETFKSLVNFVIMYGALRFINSIQ